MKRRVERKMSTTHSHTHRVRHIGTVNITKPTTHRTQKNEPRPTSDEEYVVLFIRFFKRKKEKKMRRNNQKEISFETKQKTQKRNKNLLLFVVLFRSSITVT